MLSISTKKTNLDHNKSWKDRCCYPGRSLLSWSKYRP